MYVKYARLTTKEKSIADGLTIQITMALNTNWNKFNKASILLINHDDRLLTTRNIQTWTIAHAWTNDINLISSLEIITGVQLSHLNRGSLLSEHKLIKKRKKNLPALFLDVKQTRARVCGLLDYCSAFLSEGFVNN